MPGALAALASAPAPESTEDADARDALAAVLERAVTDYLTHAVDPLGDESVAALERGIEVTLAPEEAGRAEPESGFRKVDALAAVGRVDGDASDDLVLAVRLPYDVVAVTFLGGDGFRPVRLPVTPEIDWFRKARTLYETSLELARVSDAAWQSVVLSYCCQAGTGEARVLYVWQWDAGRHGFTAVMDEEISGWAGAAGWSLDARADGSSDVVISNAFVDVFGHKLDENRSVSTTWRWSPEAKRLVVSGRSESPAVTKVHQASIAETALASGDYAGARAGYRRLVRDRTLTNGVDDHPPDWTAFAHLRLGLIHASLGQGDKARRELTTARVAGGPIGEAAGGLLEVLARDLGPVQAWGAACKGVAATPGSNPSSTCNQQLAVTSYLDVASPDALLDADALTNALRDLGTTVRSVTVGDLDGDGTREVAFGKSEWDGELWIAYRGSDRWRLIRFIPEASWVEIVGVARDVERERDVLVLASRSMVPALVGVALDEGRVAALYEVVRVDGAFEVGGRLGGERDS